MVFSQRLTEILVFLTFKCQKDWPDLYLVRAAIMAPKFKQRKIIQQWWLDHKTLQWEKGHFETLLVCLRRRCAMATLPAISNNLSIFSPVLAEHSMEWWACIFLATIRVFSEVIGSYKEQNMWCYYWFSSIFQNVKLVM